MRILEGFFFFLWIWAMHSEIWVWNPLGLTNRISFVLDIRLANEFLEIFVKAIFEFKAGLKLYFIYSSTDNI